MSALPSVPSARSYAELAHRTLEHALAYVALGWRLLPVRGKAPDGTLVPHGHRDATSDPERVQRWWGSPPPGDHGPGIGLALDASGLVAVDIDPRNRGDLTLAERKPVTLTARTGGGGLHLLYRARPGVRYRSSLGAGVDVKHHGYVIVAPSLHASGARYKWANWNPLSGDAPPLADAPAELEAGDEHDAGPAMVRVWTPELGAELRAALAVLPADDRGDWVRYGHALAAYGEAGWALWHDWSQKSKKYQGEADCRKTWDSLGQAHSVTTASIFAAADEADPGWRSAVPMPELRIRTVGGVELGSAGVEAVGEKVLVDEDAMTPEQVELIFAEFTVTESDVRNIQAAKVIWRDLIVESHIHVWAADPSAGKTAMAMQAAAELSAQGYHVVFAQEDIAIGDLPRAESHARRHGYRLVSAGLHPRNSTDVSKYLGTLRQLADSPGRPLDRYVLFFDTLKKFVDLMSKGDVKELFSLLRRLAVRGATIVLLAHLNKRKGTDERVFEGVGDVKNDTDELFYVPYRRQQVPGGGSVTTLTFRIDKARAMVQEASFVLRVDKDEHGDARMDVRQLTEVVDVERQADGDAQEANDQQYIDAVRRVLAGQRPISLLNLVDVARAEFKRSRLPDMGRDRVIELVNRYIGTHWHSRRGGKFNALLVGLEGEGSGNSAK